jgi:biotin carboxylase
MRPRVLLCATTTGYQLRMFDEAAARLGVDLRLASDRCGMLDDPWRDHAIPVRYHELDSSLDALQSNLGDSPLAGVLAVGDRPTVLAARAAMAFGVRWHPPEAAEISRNKVRLRERFAAAGLPVPWFRVLPTEDADATRLAPPYPCVVKPVILSASRGVIRADDPGELNDAVRRLRRILSATDVRALRDPDADVILVEGFVPGSEHATEGLMAGGQLHPLAIFDKPDPLDGPFFEETIYVTPSRTPDATQRAIVDAIQVAATAIGLTDGPVHAECRVHRGRVVVLEVAARSIGGLCARALAFTRAGVTIPFEELLLRHAAGMEWASWPRERRASGVMMIPIPAAGVYRGVGGEADALEVPGVTAVQITAKADQQLLPLPEGSTYLGFIFASADAPADVEAALRSAHARLRFRIDRALTMA